MAHDDITQSVLTPRHSAPPSAPPPAPRRGCFGCLGRAVLIGLLLLTLIVFAGVAGTLALISSNWTREIEDGIARLDTARERQTFETTRILDRNGQLLWEIFGEGKRTSLPLDQIPLALRYATIAVEDDSFYTNNGIDEPSLVAALIANLRNPEARKIGGSTITQQLVRHIAFDYEERVTQSYSRKLKETVLAWKMTRDYSKDEILEMYLNEIYYGNLAYGIEAAAQTYFGRTAPDLGLAELAFLAGLPQSPVELDPFTNLEGAKARQWVVLSLMVDEGYINWDQANQAYLAPLNFAAQTVSLEAPHFAVYVRQLLEAQLGAETVANGGLRVTTTLDLRYQRLAEELARRRLEELSGNNVTNAALVALKPGTGEIVALLGSVDYHNDAIDGRVNVALTPQQPGSTMKPLVYALALSPSADSGRAPWDAADLLWDVPVTYPQFDGSAYAPVNYDNRFHGPVRLRDALANSYNVPAVLTLQDVGVDRLLAFTQKLGVTSLNSDPSAYGLALALGAGEITPLEMTAAYAVFANNGYRIPPVTVLKIERSDGEVLFSYEPPVPEPVVDPRVAYLISDILDDDEARMPAMGRTNVLALPFAAAAKTGTTNDFRDNWTIGYTPGLVVGVWTGNADNSAMVNVSGLTGAAPLWSGFMQAVYADPALQTTLAHNGGQPPTNFLRPDGMVERPLCRLDAVVDGATECARGGSEWQLLPQGLADVTPTPTATPEPGVVPVVWEELDPAVRRLPAVAVAADVPVDSGDPEALPPQRFCYVPEGFDSAEMPPSAAPAVFLTPPRNRESARGAYEWAFANGLAIVPALPCTDELLVLRDPNAPAVWRITSPRPGDTIQAIVPIVGTADFDVTRVQFYKLEVTRVDRPDGWVTLGEIHTTPVTNGQLEVLNTPGLVHNPAWGAGDYLLRLIVVQNDGNYVGEPYTVAVTLAP